LESRRDTIIGLIKKEKALPILATLSRTPKGVREIQRAVGGSASTIQQRLRELGELGFVEETEVWDDSITESGYLESKKWMKITQNGNSFVERLKQLGLWQEPLLELNRQKWILLDLHSLQQIRGRTRFMKILFLQDREFQMTDGSFYRFKPWYYGPFSREFFDDAEELRYDGILNVNPITYRTNRARQATIWEHTLTPKGSDIANKLVKEASVSITQEITDKLGRFNAMSLHDLLKYVYDKYPKYITRSVLDWKEEFEF